MRRWRSRVTAIAVAVAMMASMVGFAVPASGADECTPCGTPLVVDLLAGQTMKVGTVTINNNAEMLCVTYDITEPGGWLIYETHTEASTDYKTIPHTSTGNPIPGQFRYAQYFSPGVTTWTECIPLADIPATAGTPIAVAAHAVVKSGDMLPVDAFDATDGVKYLTTDTTTKGDWTGKYAEVSSPLGRYGSCAYILPDPPTNQSEISAGTFTAPIGYEYSNPATWPKLGMFPYNWTGNQVSSLVNYKADSPYWDEFGKSPLMTAFDYTVSGTWMGIEPDPRALLNDVAGEMYSRAACGFQSGQINMRVWVPEGAHELSLYLLDFDSFDRAETVTVTAGSDSDSTSVSAFHDGVYETFYVYMPTGGGYADIAISKTAGANAVISGAFLDSSGDAPLDPALAEVAYLGDDWTTQGDWMGVYGAEAGLKCAWNVPASKTVYPWNEAYDHSWFGAGVWDYAVTAGQQYAWTDASPFVTGVQYPVFEWAWGYGTASRPADPRAAFYPIKNYWRLACWDDGGERNKPAHGYEDFNLHFPEGTYVLSLYAYDYERVRVAQTYQLFDAGNMATPVETAATSGTEFDEGAYKLFTVVAPAGGKDVVVRVYNEVGNPTNINVLLSGIFVDCVRSTRDETAWSAGPRFVKKGNWATFTNYTVQECAPVLVETITVPATSSTGVTSSPLAAGKSYRVEVSGTWQFVSWAPSACTCGIDSAHMGYADAGYSHRVANSPLCTVATEGWISGDLLATPYQHYLELKVNDSPVDWGTFNPAHVYTYGPIAGSGTPLSFKILDNVYSDNTGFLTVNIYELP